jgi:hypothetical protein
MHPAEEQRLTGERAAHNRGGAMHITRAVKSTALALAAAMVVHGETRKQSLLGDRQVVGPAHGGQGVQSSSPKASVEQCRRRAWS